MRSALLLLPCLAGCPSDDGTAPTDTPTPTEPTGDTGADTLEARLRRELDAAGFEIREGYAAELDPAECCGWESCYLFNPDNRYLGWWVPPGPGQTAPNSILDPDGLALAWRLRPDEAVLAFGRTPPDAAYFSYRSYLHDRWYPDTGRDWFFFNLGDSLNQFVVGTGPGGPFDADFLLMTTPDAGTEARVRRAAVAAGLPDEQVNVDVIAKEDLRLGLQEDADTFRMQNRMALFADPAAGDAYVADPPLTVWRVTPKVEQVHVPLVPAPLRARGTGTDESAWAGAMDALDAAVRATHGDYVPHPLPTVVPTADDDECPPGCNRDTFFGVSIHYLLPETADAFVVVYGVNHARTGKSVYSNFSVIETEHLSAVAAVHSGDMPGSARDYLPDDPQVDDLYAWRIARTCDVLDPYCIEVPYECPGFSSTGEGSVAFRAYTEAATGTGPLTRELVVDRAILFTRPAESSP